MKTKEILKIVKKEINVIKQPKTVQIALSNGRGVDAIPCVSVGDYVKKGDVIAKWNGSYLSTNIHASIDGVISDIKLCSSLNSQKINCM